MPQFIAIPVAQGDSFYLERDGFSALVDGGRSQSALPQMFRNGTLSGKVNVLVCTHNDADHANGVLGFLESSLRCDEIWLPGRWLAALPDLLKPFEKVLDVLDNAIAEIAPLANTNEPGRDSSPIEVYADRLAHFGNGRDESDDSPIVGEDGWPEYCSPMLEQFELWEDSPWRLFDSSEEPRLNLRWSAIDAANRIRNIANAAFHQGIPVRWFEYDTANPGGGELKLRPLNAREVKRARSFGGSLLHLLALTVSNRESLVFLSPQTNEYPDVLFTADSDLDGISLPTHLHGAVITAPHHGSEANANAYRLVGKATGCANSSVTWVRSDGRYKKRPGVTYCGLSSRFCTLCRLSAGQVTPKQAVCLVSDRTTWVPTRSTSRCACV